MNLLKRVFKLSLFTTCLLAPLLLTQTPIMSKAEKPEEDLTFKLTDDDIKGLNLSESEAGELRQFFDALNNLSPTEKQQLKDLGQETEKKMRDKKLDPTNFDDLVKFMEEEEKAAKGIAPAAPAPSRRIEEEISEKPTAIPAVTPIISPKSSLALLQDIERRTDSLLVKAKTREVIQKKLSSLHLEIAELRYFVKVLQDPELSLLLSSKEFSGLHNHLKSLQNALATYEPSIIARKRTGDVDDPYEMLGVEYDATPKQITEAYNALKATKSPEAVQKALASLPEKERKKRIKEARLTWSFIQGAYETLKDPKERAIVRKELQEKISQEERNEKISRTAFDKLYSAFTTAFYPHAILRDIRALLEKHKPEELEHAKKVIEAEKKAESRARVPTRIEIAPVRMAQAEEPYAAFYQKMAQESYLRPTYPTPSFAPVTPQAAEQGAQVGGGKKGEKKEGKKEGEKKEGKEGKEGGKKAGKKEEKITEKDIPDITTINEIENLLKNMKDGVEVPQEDEGKEHKPKKGRGGKKEEENIVKLEVIARNLRQDVIKPVVRGEGVSQAAQQARQFFEENRLTDLAAALEKLDKGPGKSLSGPACKQWIDRIWNQYGAKLKKLQLLYAPIGFAQRGPIARTKAQLYKLNTPEPKPEDIFKKKKKDEKEEDKAKKKKKPKAPKAEEEKEEEEGELPGINLGEIRDTIKKIDAHFDNISSGCGKKGAPPAKPIKPKKEKREEEKEEEEEAAEKPEKPEEPAKPLLRI